MESLTHRGLSAMLVASLSAALCTAGIVHAAAGRVEQPGTFALLGGTPKVSAKFWDSHPDRLSGTLQVRQFAMDGKPILDYDVDMERTMHMIIVRDDFATFDHLHPDFDARTGTFWQDFTKQPNHRYYVYTDTTPHGLSQQVFRFTLDSTGPVSNGRRSFTPSERTASAGPYTVTLSKTTLPAERPKHLHLTVVENDEPAQDLSPYLGAAAHVVFINTSTLAYVHLHPTLRRGSDADTSMSSGMNMATPTEGRSGPFMSMAVPALPTGTYKLWVQFLGNGKLYTVPFTLLAR